MRIPPSVDSTWMNLGENKEDYWFPGTSAHLFNEERDSEIFCCNLLAIPASSLMGIFCLLCLWLFDLNCFGNRMKSQSKNWKLFIWQKKRFFSYLEWVRKTLFPVFFCKKKWFSHLNNLWGIIPFGKTKTALLKFRKMLWQLR